MTGRAAGEDRQATWRGAQMLGALSEPDGFPARYGAWAVEAPLPLFNFEDIAEAARWPVAELQDLPFFQRCVGVGATASAWRSLLDGERLRWLSEALSISLLDAALALDPSMLPDPRDEEDGRLDGAALARLGRRLLLVSLPGSVRREEGPDAVRARLAVEAGVVLFERTRRPDA